MIGEVVRCSVWNPKILSPSPFAHHLLDPSFKFLPPHLQYTNPAGQSENHFEHHHERLAYSSMESIARRAVSFDYSYPGE